MPRLHRNNAAEWVMTVVLLPVAWMIRFWRWLHRPASEPPKDRKSPRRGPVIEGLPPRDMN